MKKRLISVILIAAVSFASVFLFASCNKRQALYFYVPDGPPLLAVANIFYNTPQLVYEGGTRDIRFVMSTGAAIGPRIAGGFPDFALAPINLAASNYNLVADSTKSAGSRYIFGGVALWGMLNIVEDVRQSGGNEARYLNDLVGQVIYAYQPQMSPGIVLRTVFEEAGFTVNVMNVGATVDANAINIVFLEDNAAARSALVGEIAAIGDTARFALLADPVVTALTTLPHFRLAFNMQDEWYSAFGFSFPQVAIMVRASLAERNPALVSAMIDMIEEAISFTRENPNEAASYARDADKLNSAYLPGVPVIQAFLNGRGQDVFRFKSAIESKDSVSQLFAVLYQHNSNLIGGRVPDSGFFFNP